MHAVGDVMRERDRDPLSTYTNISTFVDL